MKIFAAWAATVILSLADSAPESPFGIGSCYINNRSVKDMERWMPQMEKISLRFHRNCETSWHSLEKKPGEWYWKNLDAQVRYLEEKKISFGGLLLGHTRAKGGPGGLPVDDLEGWSNYVGKVVGRLKGKVKYWEVWNEPPNFIAPGQTHEDYAKIVVAAYQAAKKADPNCLIGLAAKSAHLNFLEQTIQAGAKDHFDYITLHPYESLGTVAGNMGTEPHFLTIVPTLRKMLAAQNPAKVDVPVIFTELGTSMRGGEDQMAEALIKGYTLSIAQGVTRVHWFEGRDGDSGPMGLLDQKGRPRQAYHALGKMISHLGQHPEYLGWILFDSRTYGFLFEGPKGKILIAWSAKHKGHPIKLSSEVSLSSPLSDKPHKAKEFTLTPTPVFVTDLPDSILKVIGENRSKPMPWGQDFSSVKSVSIRFGDRVKKEGIHPLSSQEIPGLHSVYGGTGRATKIPYQFVVNPEFLSYDSVPLEVEIVVRRLQQNKNAGFKLTYESRAGLKSTDWFTIPDNKKWHTVKWQINDPQFVGMWGYHFALNSDGNQFNQYALQSIKVTKL